MTIASNQFEDLKEQICNKQMWDKERFVIFDYEAGTGKSLNAQRFIGELTKEQPHKVLYVQRFARDEELSQTADTINKHADASVAVAYTSQDYKGKQAITKKLQAINSQVLCITHKMYSQICKGEHKELIEKRDILIIDEYPDLLEKVTVSLYDLSILWAECFIYDCPEIVEMATRFRDKIGRKDAMVQSGEMVFHSFQSVDYDDIRRNVSSTVKLIDNTNHRLILNKCLQLLETGGYVYEGELHTFQNNINFTLLKNNIILDANAGFDYRYELSNKFVVRKQVKTFEYARSTFHHIDVSTTKKSLNTYVDFDFNVIKSIEFEKRKGVLFITDKAKKEDLENCFLNVFGNYGNTIEEIAEGLNFSVDYFGNIIGTNIYRDFDTVIVMKTPNFEYLTYVLTNMFYKIKEGQPVESITVFQHDDIEQLRKTTVAGEIYQAIKRINRDNSQSAEIFVYSDFQGAVEVIVKQLPQVNFMKGTMEVSKKRKDYDSSNRLQESAVYEVQRVILEAMNEGLKSVKKKNIRKQAGIKDAGNFSKILRELERFFAEHGIRNAGQELIFNSSLTNNGVQDERLNSA
ncbi:DEAD/DEAH box helicase family protein [Paenibacillus glycinis]|uniref:Helicase/UvrB N-terminal domain-containing protein n=1 Tax=Paenibacillus glycinis TaxID=2697035 RepID=A0ABW9XSK1_9BACL|nr:DEAD/DEAH box helicase family protein [Paenibacillus glycinis]NBD25628.1 hypothetical protein [Paenibacillus glycinis]